MSYFIFMFFFGKFVELILPLTHNFSIYFSFLLFFSSPNSYISISLLFYSLVSISYLFFILLFLTSTLQFLIVFFFLFCATNSVFFSESLFSAPRKLPAMLDAGQSLAAMYQARLKHSSTSATSSSSNGPQLNAVECVYSCYLVTVSHFICNGSRTTGMRKTTQALTTQQIIEDYAGASNALHTTSHSLASPNSTRSRSASTVFSESEDGNGNSNGKQIYTDSGSRSGSGRFDLFSLSGFAHNGTKIIENCEFGTESVLERESQNHGNSTETDIQELQGSEGSKFSSAFSTSISSAFSTALSISKSMDMITIEGMEDDDNSVKIDSKVNTSVKLGSDDENGNSKETVISDSDSLCKDNEGKGNEGRVGEVGTYVYADIHTSDVREVTSYRERRGSSETRERRGSGEMRERRGSVDDEALVTALRSLPLDISRLKNNHLPTHTQAHTPHTSSSSSRNQGQGQCHGSGRRVRTSTLSPEDEAINLAAAKLGLKVAHSYNHTFYSLLTANRKCFLFFFSCFFT